MGARRIVSLVPSLTHMVCDFGLRDELVGCTSFCIEPKGLARTVALIGGTKDPDVGKILALQPTHVLVNEEENKPGHIAELAAAVPTLVTFPRGPEDVPGMLREAGRFLDAAQQGEDAARDAEAAFAAAQTKSALAGRRYLYYIWREPYMIAGPDTYISRMLAQAGLVNAAPERTDTVRYPELPIAEARSLGADLLLLSSEPYPFRRRDVDRLRADWPDAPEILKCDGQLLSWYGTMTATALRALAAADPSLIRPF